MSYFNTRRRMNALVVVLLVINIFSISALWLAKKSNKPGPPKGPEKGELFLKKALDLSSEQFETIKVLRTDHFEEMQALRRANRENRRNMFEQIKAVKPDSILLVKYAAQIGSVQAALEELTTNHFLDIKKELNPEQTLKFNQTLERLLPPPPGMPGGPLRGGPGGRDRPGRRPPPR